MSADVSRVLVELRSLRQRGWRSIVSTAACFKTSASSFGCVRLTPKNLLHVNCGVQAMYSWAAVVSHPATTSTPNSSTITLTPRSPVFDPQLMVLRRRPSQHHRPMSISLVLNQSPLTNWLLRSECYLTRATLLIHYRLQHSSPSSMFSHLFWQHYSIVHWLPPASQPYSRLTSPEKGRSGFFGCVILPSNLQSISPSKATWKTRCSPAPCQSQLKWSATKIPVGVPSSPLNGDRCAEGLDGHSSCSRHGHS